MNPQEALKFLDSIVAQVALNREQHAMAVAAVNALQKAISPDVDRPKLVK